MNWFEDMCPKFDYWYKRDAYLVVKIAYRVKGKKKWHKFKCKGLDIGTPAINGIVLGLCQQHWATHRRRND